MASKKQFNFSRNTNQQANKVNQPTAKTSNANQVDDEDFLDISDTELIRASQVVESQLKFTNNVHHTTSNALNIFSQFTNDAPQSQFQSQMAAPAMTVTGHQTRSYQHGSQFNTPLDTYSQLADTKDELKMVKTQNMQKEGEVKILRDKLKKQDQEIQRVRTEKCELVKKLQQQQLAAKKDLEKQIEFKELENQFKSQELIDLTMKCRQMEARLKKASVIQGSAPATTSVNTYQHRVETTIKQEHSFQNQMNTENIFDQEFSRKKANGTQPPPLNPSTPICNKTHGIKRLAPQGLTDSLFHSDGENENPVHESKRPYTDNKESKDSSKQTHQNPTNIRLTLGSIGNVNSVLNNSHNVHQSLSTPSNVIKELKREDNQLTKNVKVQQSTPFIQNQTLPNPVPFMPTPTSSIANATNKISTPQSTSNPSPPPKVEYKRSSKLNLKSFHQVKTIYSINSQQSAEIFSMENSKKKLSGSGLMNSNDTIKIKSHTNEKIYNLIDLFAESANNLNKFNSTTQKIDAYAECKSLVFNPNATNLNIHSLTKQLTSLLDYMSYKSVTSPISSDLFSSFITASLTESSISSATSGNNSLLIIDRVEFVSSNLNDELLSVIKYCLNASFTPEGQVSFSSARKNIATQMPRLLSFTSISPSSMHTPSTSNETLKRLIYASKNKPTPASSCSITDLLCYSFEVCASLFLFRASLLLINYTQNELNRKTYKLMKSKNINISHQPVICTNLIKLKQEFFWLIRLMLEAINFADTPKAPQTSQDNSDAFSSLSTSSTPYSTLKILNTVLEYLNHLIYLPVSSQQLDPNSIKTWFYFSLADNIHNMFKKKMNLNQLTDLTHEKMAGQTSEVKQESKNIEMIEIDGANEDVIIIDEQAACNSDTAEMDYDECGEESREHCLFQLFYKKLINYFGDTVYTLEASEARHQNTIDENPSIISSISNTTSSSGRKEDSTNGNIDINTIITTIGSDEHESNKRVLNFNLDNKPQTPPTLQHSKSQAELQFELMQSQAMETDEKKMNPTTTNTNHNQQKNTAIRTYKKYLNDTNSDCIHFLQIQLLNNFVYYLHNYQLIMALENKFTNIFVLKARMDEKSNNTGAYTTHSKSCMCYKDMLNSFVILIDYQFNEKFYYGADLSFDECFWTKLSSDCLIFPDQLKKADRISKDNVEVLIEEVKLEKKILRSNKSHKQQANTLCNLNDKTSQFFFLLIMRCAYALNSIFKNSSVLTQMDQAKFKFYDSMRNDYRLKNFYCLYMLADVIYEEFQKESAEVDRTLMSTHLFSSLSSLRTMFKVDEYFELE